MAQPNEQTGADETEAYDKAHGRTTVADEQKSSKLTEAGNKPPPQDAAFRITTTK
jgi:hypothetical protein